MECFLKNQILDTNTYNTTNITKVHVKKCRMGLIFQINNLILH